MKRQKQKRKEKKTKTHTKKFHFWVIFFSVVLNFMSYFCLEMVVYD